MNRRLFVSAIATILLGARLLTAAPAAELPRSDEPKIDLRPRFTVGQENRFRVTMVSRTQTQFLDTPRVRLQEYQQTMRVRRKVIEASESGATIEIVYEAVAVTLIAGNKTISFDSDGINSPEPEEVLGPTARNALNRPFTIKVDQYGKVLSVSGNTQDGTKMAAVNLIDTDILTRSLGPIYGLGKEPSTAAIGETWSATRESKPGLTGTFSTTVRSTLRSVTGDRADIDVDGKVNLELSEKAKEGKAELSKQEVRGDQIWNVLGGVVDRSFFQQTMSVTADVEAKKILQEVGEVRRRQADTLLYVGIDRIDDGVGALPPLPPVPEAVAAPVDPAAHPSPAGTAPAAPATAPLSPAVAPVKKD
jgi:hypothetical protein